MAKTRILQHAVLAFFITAVLLFSGWILSGQPNLRDLLFGKGFWYYTLLHYMHVTPLASNLFSMALLLSGAAIAAAAVSKLTNHWIGSPVVGVLYACNPWMLHMTEPRSLYLLVLFGIPLLFICATSIPTHRFALPFTAALLGLTALLAPATILGSAIIILSANLLNRSWWKGFTYAVLFCSAIVGIILHMAFVTEAPNADSLARVIAASFDLATLNSIFPLNSILQRIFTLSPLSNAITPNTLAGLAILCLVLVIVFYKKVQYTHLVFLGTGIVAGIFALGPVLQFAGEVQPTVVLPYAVFGQIFPHLTHRPAVLICILGFTFLIFIALLLQTLRHTRTSTALTVGTLVVIILGVQVLPLPFPVSSRVHFVGYSQIQPAVAQGGNILEFHEEEESLFAPYSEQRYLDSGIVPISASSQPGKTILQWLQNPLRVIPQNTQAVYSALLRDYFHIVAIDQITCVPGMISTQPRFTDAEDISGLPIELRTIHADKCHTLSAVAENAMPIQGILSQTSQNEGVSRVYPSRDNPQSVKFIDDAKLVYLNTTSNDQVIHVTITAATAEPLHVGIAADSEFVYNEFFDQLSTPQTFTFSFPAQENSSILLDFVLKDSENTRITKNKQDSGLQIQHIAYSIENVVHY